MTRRARMIGLSQEAWKSFVDLPDLSSMVALMRNTLHLALAFSPLLVLQPKKLVTEGIHRDHLLAVRFIFPALSNIIVESISACNCPWQ